MTVEILNIFEEVTTKRVAYCKFCLKTEIEGRLVSPVFVKMFLNAANISIKDVTACNLCESSAEAAIKFLYLVNFAKTIEPLFADLRRNGSLKLALTHLTEENMKRDDVRIALDIEQQFQLIKNYSQPSTENTTQKNIAVVDEQSCHKETKTVEDEIETVLLDDDDEEYMAKAPIRQANNLAVLPKLVPLRELLNPAPDSGFIGTSVILAKTDDSNITLYPTCETPAGLEVPLLSARLSKGQLVPRPASADSMPTVKLPVPKTVQTPDKNSVFVVLDYLTESLNPVVLEENVTLTRVPGIPVMPDGTLIFEMSPSFVSDLTKDLVQAKDVDAATNNADANGVPLDTVGISEEKTDGPVKAPVEKPNSRIDWEDKIPMDVITFVDSNSNNDLIVTADGEKTNYLIKHPNKMYAPKNSPPKKSRTVTNYTKTNFKDEGVKWIIADVASISDPVDDSVVCLDD